MLFFLKKLLGALINEAASVSSIFDKLLNDKRVCHTVMIFGASFICN